MTESAFSPGFCTFPIPEKDGKHLPLPELGVYISELTFRCGEWDTVTGFLDQSTVGAPSLSPPVPVWLKPLPVSELPGRAHMKASRQYWSRIPLYLVSPICSDRDDLSEPICHIYVRSVFHPSTVHSRGVCAIVRDY